MTDRRTKTRGRFWDIIVEQVLSRDYFNREYGGKYRPRFPKMPYKFILAKFPKLEKDKEEPSFSVYAPFQYGYTPKYYIKSPNVTTLSFLQRKLDTNKEEMNIIFRALPREVLQVSTAFDSFHNSFKLD